MAAGVAGRARRLGPMRRVLPGLSPRDMGPFTIAALVVACALVWLAARPAGEPLGRHVGQLFGVESIVLMSVALVLISTLPWVEAWFDGIDRAAIWHRRLAIAGLVLLAPHLALSSNPDGTALGGPLGAVGAIGLVALAVWAVLPRLQAMLPRPVRAPILALAAAPVVRHALGLLGGYERWRTLHRTTGLFVAAGFVHGLLDATAFGGSTLLRVGYVAIGGTGLAFYVYRELLARYFAPLHDYQVAAVRTLDAGLTEIALAPLGRPFTFVPGQFAMIYLEARDGWHRHPFTMTSAPGEGHVRFTVKALGDYTSRLGELVEPGMPAVIGGPHGRFDRRNGTAEQVWIGGGVGVAPFLSWLRSLDGDLDERVHFFYSNDGEPPFAEEVRAIAERHPTLSAHLVDTRAAGRLDPAQVLARTGADPRALSVFMCGPTGMLRTFQAELRRAGVLRRNIHREHFDWR